MLKGFQKPVPAYRLVRWTRDDDGFPEVAQPPRPA
jgi:hypothetical protein